MPVHLTDTAIAKAAREVAESSSRRELADAVCPGLRLRLAPAGGKTWALACRDREGRMRRFSLGSYPGVGISKARDAAKAMRVRVRQEGADPVADRKRERAIGRDARAGIGTMAALLEIYAAQEGGRLKTWDQSRRRIERVFKPHLGRPLATMKASDLQMTADRHASRSSSSGAVRCLRPILKWGAQRQYVSADVASIVPPSSVARRDRVLDREEMCRLLKVLRASDRPHAACMRFLLLTLARRGEGESARWRDIDLVAGTWTIRETKNGQPHVVPLSTCAKDLLREQMPTDDQGNLIVPDNTSLVFATSAGTLLGNWDREAKAIMTSSGTDGWHRHDLRRTGATMLGDMGETPDIVEAALNHVAIRSPLAATYNRSRYRPQVAAALQRLADALEAIENGDARPVPML